MKEQDLTSLEARLQARIAPQPAAELRGQVLSRLDAARRRERSVKLVATMVGVISFAVGLALVSTSLPTDWNELRDTGAEDPVPFANAFDLDANEEQRVQLFLANARVPRIAPPMGSMELHFEEGL